MEILGRFEAVSGEYLKFKSVENKRSQRPDVHAFLLLAELFPRSGPLVCCASHDLIFLDVTTKEINNLTDDQILELTRCGVMYSEDSESLSMFI